MYSGNDRFLLSGLSQGTVPVCSGADTESDRAVVGWKCHRIETADCDRIQDAHSRVQNEVSWETARNR